jgi:hypothetical protein
LDQAEVNSNSLGLKLTSADAPLIEVSTKSDRDRILWDVFGELTMPLAQGQSLAYDDQRMAFKFTMLNGEDTVQCQISGAAMDDLAGVKGTPSSDREAQFLRHRHEIERIASNMFDERAPAIKGVVVRIFSKHLGK